MKLNINWNGPFDLPPLEELFAKLKIITCTVAQVPFELMFGREMTRTEQMLAREFKEELRHETIPIHWKV